MRILVSTRAALAAATILTATAVRAEPIRVVGNERIGADAVEQAFGQAAGKRFSAAELDAGIKQLFASGFFSDIKTRREDGILVVHVTELPTIGNVVFNGNERLKDEALASVAGLTPGTPFSGEAIDKAVSAISSAYAKIGRQQARIARKSVIRDGNVADVQLDVIEGDKTRVTSITFKGASSFSKSRLQGVLVTKESGPLSLLKNDDIYDLDRTDRDLEALRAFYHDNGYIDAVVSGPDVVLDEKVNEIYLVYSVNEGRRYRVGEVSVFDTSARGVKVDGIEKGDVYSPSKAEAAASGSLRKMSRLGVSDVEVTFRPDRRPDGTVDVGFMVDDTARIYVERIEISGNQKTTDYVIRREIDFSEGDLLNRPELARVEKRLRKLGLFSAVSISLARGSAEDRAVVNVAVVEQPSGSFEIGGGYSLKDGPLAVISFDERNFMGRGRGLRASVGRGIDTGTYDFGLTEPYLFGARVTGDFSLFRREWGDQDNSYRPYDETLTGGRVAVSFPITDESLATAYYSIANQEIAGVDGRYTGIGSIADPNLVTKGDYVRSVLGGEWSYTTFDDAKDPSEGLKLDMKQELAGLGGDAHFSKTEVAAASAHQVDAVRDLVAQFSIKGGAMTGLGEDLSFIDQFRPGSELVRGFANGGIGPRDAGTGFALGGRYYAGASAEARLPTPLMPEDFGLKSAFFADAGTVWSADAGSVRASGAALISDAPSIRASIGTGIIWNAPFGLLRADFAVPVVKHDSDRTQIFSLSGGTRF